MTAPRTIKLKYTGLGAGLFNYMVAREDLRRRREAGETPWTTDPILNKWKFTNVKRECDYTTRWMRRYWTGPHQDRPPGEIVFNCALFRWFGTWEFADAVGWQTDFDPDAVAELARQRLTKKLPIFTGAYRISNNGIAVPKLDFVCHRVLAPIWKERYRIAEVITSRQRWEVGSHLLAEFEGFGGSGFMAREVLIDLMETPVLCGCTDRNSWCPVVPGARRGINRVRGKHRDASMSFDKVLKVMLVLYRQAPRVLPNWMPQIDLPDIQFNLCQFDKYERVRLGEGTPRSRYKPRRGLFDHRPEV